ncbi:MAG: helix-turn-helix domain-containing protein [Syntrophobacterales bacterium]|nr:MAG: helix-turn-helix domain-containing protein [Syntrophobacterales bacterium]
METVGQYLKRERELRNISLKEISMATKIRENILTAIEQDRHDLLPAPVFVKGFLIAYGKHVGLDPNDVVLRYESDLKEFHEYDEKEPSVPQKKGWSRGFLIGAITVMVGLGIILFNTWKESKDREEPVPVRVDESTVGQEETLPPPAVLEREEAPSSAEETISIEQAPAFEETIVVRQAPPAETPLAESVNELQEIDRGGLTLQIQAVEETWIALQVDSNLPREITLMAGETFSQRADDHIWLKIGNAGGVNVTFNGEPLGSLGDLGKIVRLSLTHEGYEFKKRGDFELSVYGDEAESNDAH